MYVSPILTLVLLLGQVAAAQIPGAPAPAAPAAAAKPAEKDPFGRDSPRGCAVGFLKAVERGDYSQAAEYLDTRPSMTIRRCCFAALARM